MLPPKQKLVVFDFDGTIYQGDSFLDFCWYYYKKKPWRVWFLVFQIFGYGLWKLKFLSATKFKSLFIQYVLWDSDEEIERLSSGFWHNNHRFNLKVIDQLNNFKYEGHLVVVASASPALFIQQACFKLGADAVLGTELVAQGRRHIIQINCRGDEKLNRIDFQFPDCQIVAAFSDNLDDLPLLEKAEAGFWVKKGEIKAI